MASTNSNATRFNFKARNKSIRETSRLDKRSSRAEKVREEHRKEKVIQVLKTPKPVFPD